MHIYVVLFWYFRFAPFSRIRNKGDLHPRNRHQGRYDFDMLCRVCPELSEYVRPSPSGESTIDFANAAAVLCLNRALLAAYYGVQHWTIPQGYLCPPIPGRADYIHALADLIGVAASKDSTVRVLDIGTGANCIYPIIGSYEYGWRFVGTDVNPAAVKNARAIVAANLGLQKKIRVVPQKDRDSIFRGILKPSDRFTLTMCNPPFHVSASAAEAGSTRKQRNLSKGRVSKGAALLNFGGQAAELWCAGGEVAFIGQMIRESQDFAAQVKWFTSLVSKSEHLPAIQKALKQAEVTSQTVVEMHQGNKASRLIAWRF